MGNGVFEESLGLASHALVDSVPRRQETPKPPSGGFLLRSVKTLTNVPIVHHRDVYGGTHSRSMGGKEESISKAVIRWIKTDQVQTAAGDYSVNEEALIIKKAQQVSNLY